MSFTLKRRAHPDLEFDACGTFDTAEEAEAARVHAVEILVANGYADAEAVVEEV